MVEDDEEIASVLQRSLRMEGYEAEVCGDGSEAVGRSRTFNPDLVVLDLGLPGLDGMEVARLLRDVDDLTKDILRWAWATLHSSICLLPGPSVPASSPARPRP